MQPSRGRSHRDRQPTSACRTGNSRQGPTTTQFFNHPTSAIDHMLPIGNGRSQKDGHPINIAFLPPPGSFTWFSGLHTAINRMRNAAQLKVRKTSPPIYDPTALDIGVGFKLRLRPKARSCSITSSPEEHSYRRRKSELVDQGRTQAPPPCGPSQALLSQTISSV